MKIKFMHVNIVAKDWNKLADFYIKVFDCIPKPPERDLYGEWLDQLTDIDDAKIKGIHLQLPGFDSSAPTIEIFEYNRSLENSAKQINLHGFAHIAFAVEDVEQKLNEVIAHGGSVVGKLVDTEVNGLGKISVVYTKDPEGNIIELQKVV